jgi:hypothetical protein
MENQGDRSSENDTMQDRILRVTARPMAHEGPDGRVAGE